MIKESFRAFILLCLFASSAIAEPALDSICAINPAQEKIISDCLKFKEENNCDELESNEQLQPKVLTCHVSENERAFVDNSVDVVAGCGVGVKDHVISIFQGVMALPSVFGEAVKKTNEARRLAEAICKQKKYQASGTSEIINMSSCVDRETVNIRNVHINWDEYKKAIEELKLKALCLKPEYRAQTICPIAVDIASMVAGGAILQSGKNFVRNTFKGIKKLAAESDSRLAALESKAASSAEKKSILHQEDLLTMVRNPEVLDDLRKAKIDIVAIERGMVDSDMGKLASVRAEFVNGSGASRDLIRVLQGKSTGPEAKLMKEIFKESGMEGKSLLPSHLTEAQIEEVFKSQPALGGYLHELPGMREAVADLRNGRISQVDFKKRMQANLFHNGPQAGFWDFFSDTIIPGALKNGTPEAKSFFKGTVFEGKTVDGVVRPKYPSPTTAEGVFHTMVDRLSQATGGGISKIYDEVAGKAFSENPKIKLGDLKIMADNGLSKYHNLLGQNLKDTQLQLKKLKEHTDSLGSLSSEQKGLLKNMITQAEKRIDNEYKFFQDHVSYLPDAKNIEKIEMQFKDAAGIDRKFTLDKNTPADEAQKLMEHFTKAEEKVNGHPFEGFKGQSKLNQKPFIAGGAMAIPMALKCPIGMDLSPKGKPRMESHSVR